MKKVYCSDKKKVAEAKIKYKAEKISGISKNAQTTRTVMSSTRS